MRVIDLGIVMQIKQCFEIKDVHPTEKDSRAALKWKGLTHIIRCCCSRLGKRPILNALRIESTTFFPKISSGAPQSLFRTRERPEENSRSSPLATRPLAWAFSQKVHHSQAADRVERY